MQQQTAERKNMNPNQIVNTHGDDITITRVVGFEVGRDGGKHIIRDYTHTKGVISQPGRDDTQRLEGRLDEGAIQVTVQTDEDVQTTRQGGRDRILIGHVDPSEDEDVSAYSVVNVQDDRHNLVGVEKKTLMCNRFGGRNDVRNDADLYIGNILEVEYEDTHNIAYDTRETYHSAVIDGELTLDGELRMR